MCKVAGLSSRMDEVRHVCTDKNWRWSHCFAQKACVPSATAELVIKSLVASQVREF